MQDTPKGNRLHIAIFGRRNAGKSSLINALTRQDIALVSPIPGTTTDPVYKAMELLPIGPVMLIDTAGIDDTGFLGELRVKRTMSVLHKTDLALMVVDPFQGWGEFEEDIIRKAREESIPLVGVLNKADLCSLDGWAEELERKTGIPFVVVSSATKQGMETLKAKIIETAPQDWTGPAIVGDLISPGDKVVMVVPIDKAAPKGRLILPQVQAIRDVLDHSGMALVVKEDRLEEAIEALKQRPRLVVTDSQAFKVVEAVTPQDIPLTSFSILFARHKGDLKTLVEGARAIQTLRPGDKVLIAEACTHHRVSDDIGTVKIPRWLRQVVGSDLNFEWVSGTGYAEKLSGFKLVIHCGACMINRREMLYRILLAEKAGVPIVNYGVAIAMMHGILRRALSPFPSLQAMVEDELSGGSGLKTIDRGVIV